MHFIIPSHNRIRFKIDMTKDNYLALKEFENKLMSARNSGYARFSAPELEKFSKVLAEHRGTPLSRQERTCPHCLLTTLKKVAEEYLKYQESPRGKQLLKSMEDNNDGIEESEPTTQSDAAIGNGAEN